MTDCVRITEPEAYEDSVGRRLALWAGVLSGPVVWFLDQQAKVLLVPWICSGGSMLVLYIATGVSLALVGGGAWAAWRCWRDKDSGPRKTLETGLSRTEFMALLGMMLCGLFVLVIVAQTLPVLLLDPCR